MIGKLGFKAAVTVKDTVAKKIEEERKKKDSKSPQNAPKEIKVQHAANGGIADSSLNRPEHYISDDDTSFV